MKFILSYYNKKTGESTVKVRHLRKNFYGKAQLHPEDVPSEYFGCRIAEKRAMIQALKYERRIAKKEAEICRKFCQSCIQYAKFNPEDASAKSMARQLSVKINRVNNITNEINILLMEIKTDILKRKKILNMTNKDKDTT